MEQMTNVMANYYDAANAFHEYNVGNGLSKHTIRGYDFVTRTFGQFLQEYGYDDDGPTPKAVTEWKNRMNAKGVKATSIRQLLIQLRSFFTWACDEELGNYYYTENPVSTRHNPKIRNTDRPYENLLTQEEVAMLLVDDNRTSNLGRKLWARNYAIIVVLLTTAIRNGEMLDLTPNDLDYERGIIEIKHGKGNKYRTVQFPLIAQQAVKKYLASGYRPASAGDDEVLFGTMADVDGHRSAFVGWHRGTQPWLSKVVRSHVRKITGRDNVMTHALRHASAATLLNAGLSMEEIQVILGHTDIETTQRYTGRLAEAEVNKHAVKIFDEMEFLAKRAELREAG